MNTKTINPLRIYNVLEASKLLRINPQTLIEYCRAGKIKARKIGEWKILGSAIVDFMGGK